MTDESQRLAKHVAAMVPCSRSQAEQYIEGGWVRVDGKIVEEPQFRVSDSQKVVLDPDATLLSLGPVTVLMHKPPGMPMDQAAGQIGPGTHAADDASGIRLVKKHFKDLQAVTPLMREASGLVVFTQNPGIARKLIEDARGTEQEVVVEVSGQIAERGLQRLCHGLSFNGQPLPPIKVSWQNETRLRFALKGIAPGQVPSMCEQVGLRVVAMKRIRIGRVPMGQLPAGQWRYLLAHERF